MVHSKRYIFIGETLRKQNLTPSSLSRTPLNERKINDSLLLVDRVFDLLEENPALKNELTREGN